MKNFKYIYGPVSSWRLGSSLGIDLLSGKKKVCTFDCRYCQLGKAAVLTTKRKLYVPTEKIIQELSLLPQTRIDYITFSGRGEPTLAINLGAAIRAVKEIRREPIAVLTNSTLMYRKDVRRELALSDLVVAKLDADSAELLKLINQPAETISLNKIVKGIKQFRKEYQGKLALQIMFTEQNLHAACGIARLAKAIHLDEVQINTPTRSSLVKPLSRAAIREIKRHFRGMKVISLYDDAKRKKVFPLSSKKTMLRRGKVLL